MLTYMLELARKTGGYFDPTIGKRLTELGYGKAFFSHEDGKRGDYRDITLVGDEVTLASSVELEFG